MLFYPLLLFIIIIIFFTPVPYTKIKLTAVEKVAGKLSDSLNLSFKCNIAEIFNFMPLQKTRIQTWWGSGIQQIIQMTKGLRDHIKRMQKKTH